MTRTYRITARKEPPFYATTTVEAETANEALELGLKHDWDNEPFAYICAPGPPRAPHCSF